MQTSLTLSLFSRKFVDTSKNSKFMDFIASKANFLGSGFALATLTTGSFLLPMPLWATLGLGGISYVAGLFLGSENHKPLNFEAINKTVTVETIKLNISQLRESVTAKEKLLPNEIVEKVNNIFSTLEDIVPKWDSFSSFSDEKYTISSIVTDYLPQTINNYLNLPQSYYKNSTKKQFAEEAENQLDILLGALSEVRESLYKGVEKDINTQTLFLKSKFTKTGISLP